ncbi:MAG: excinuclease ABC subunit UvrA [Muribaculaceae bacterium]|nr:excinuclease ABC subunit UvrA [Muribaculaceae bacterium]
MNVSNITVKGARVNNLKNVDVEIPRNQLVVITGLSGSGKSSLAFDTLYAEGRRRYVESLSAYARQFMGKLRKPECDFIKGLPPAIAIEQKVNTRNPRSTVGTSTEIYDYLRMLFGRIGRTYSPVSGRQVKKHTVADVVEAATSYPEGTRIAVVAPIVLPEGRTIPQQLDIYLKEGYSRVVDKERNFIDIENIGGAPGDVDLLIDRLAVAHGGDEVSRLAESAETAFFEGHGECSLLVWEPDGGVKCLPFSKRFEADGITFDELSDQMFNFNNPVGACPVCEGFGKTLDIAEELVVPNPGLSLFEGCVAPWRGPSSARWREAFIHAAAPLGFPVHTAYDKLDEKWRDLLWEGDAAKGVQGINAYFDYVSSKRAAVEYRMILARYRGRTTCRACRGTRLKPGASYVKVGGATISQLVAMPVKELQPWFDALELDDADSAVAGRLLTEIRRRLNFLVDVGLGYLTLDRLSNSLSGGESQRINLATQLGSSLVGSLYILDEPSIGLHSRDTDRLIEVLRRLQQLGNTVVVVEHDEDIMRHADRIIDVGPGAGTFGGEIVYQGPPKGIEKCPESYTMKYLTGELGIEIPASRRRWRDFIRVEGASEHNLKGIDVDFPLGVFTCVTGVSGSGKSTLVRDIFYRALVRHYTGEGDAPGRHAGISGDLKRASGVIFVDQNPIGRSSRSNPATYLKAYDEIRALMASQPLAKQLDIPAGYFSFNTEGGRCEACKGEGYITIEMQFLADVTVECEECHGRRFKRPVLDVRYRGLNIADILDLTVDAAIEFFSAEGAGAIEQRIVRRLRPLQEVGLGYIRLGQSSSTLSGGENQRVKLAYYLSMSASPLGAGGGGSLQPQIFIFDEPTTGLHFHDIRLLLAAFKRLVEAGHTLVVVEHNLDVIKTADHLIDLGPDGGDAGGTLVVAGTPEEVAACPESLTGQYLKAKLEEKHR